MGCQIFSALRACYGENEYKQFTIAYLKDLKYLDYELINETVRQKAEDRYKDDIKDKDMLNANNKGGNTQNAENKDDQHHQIDAALKDAKIECTDGLLDKIIKEDEDAKKLANLPKFQEYFQGCEQGIDEMTQKYQTDMKNGNEDKK